jgi:lipoprotein-anchoring transpeptidase ErfK/SrfK
MRRTPRFLPALAAVLATLVLLLSACGGDTGPTLSARKESRVTATTAVGTTATPATTPLPAGYSYVGQAQVPVVKVYDAPGGTQPSREFENPWHVNDDPRYPVQTVFLVDEQRGDWLKVLLPIRPNGSTGWIKRSDVNLVANPYRIDVDLGDHSLKVYNADKLYLEDTVAIGAAGTPTPIGRFYIRVLLQPPDQNTVYGPYAYGLSSHSETLNEFNGGDAEVGIHGNNDASVLGKDVSHGCIRMDNTKITQLAKVLMLGTPVEVRA